MEELYVEYMEDAIEKDPMAAYPPDQDVTIMTGDPLIDRWQQDLAKGETPDIGATFQNDPAIAAWLNPKKPSGSGGEGGGQPPQQLRARQPTKPAPKTGVPIEPPNFEVDELEFHDDFTGGLDGEPR